MQFLATDQLSACETRQKGLIQIIELLMVLLAAAAQPSQVRLQLRALWASPGKVELLWVCGVSVRCGGRAACSCVRVWSDRCVCGTCVCVCVGLLRPAPPRRLVGMVEERRQSGRVGYYGGCSVDCMRFQLSRRSGTFWVKYPVPDLPD